MRYAVLLFILLTASAQAGTVTALNVASAARDAIGGVRAVVQFVGRGFAANDPVYVKRAVNVGRDVMGAVLRRRLFSPWGIGLAAVVTAAGYLMDDNTQEVYTVTYAPSGNCLGTQWIPSLYGVTLDACMAHVQSHVGQNQVLRQVPNGNCILIQMKWGSASWLNRANFCPDGGQTEVRQVATDPELWDAVSPQIADAQLPDILIDPETGVVDALLNPIINPIADQIAQSINAGTETTTVDASTQNVSTLTNISNSISQLIQQGEQAQDYDFTADDVTYDDTLPVPDKLDPTDLYNNAKQQIEDFKSRVGLTASAGSCSISVPVSLGMAGGSGTIDFCRFGSVLSSAGSILVGLAYLTAGLIVLGARD